MAISKKQNNTGHAGNHGMSEIDSTEILHRKLLEDKYHEESSNVTCHCKNGHEFTILGDKISLEECHNVSLTIWARKLCPYCQDWNINANQLKEIKFVIDNKSYHTIYKPHNYRFLPIDENED